MKNIDYSDMNRRKRYYKKMKNFRVVLFIFILLILAFGIGYKFIIGNDPDVLLLSIEFSGIFAMPLLFLNYMIFKFKELEN